METILMIQKAAPMGNWWLAASSWQRTHSCIMSHAEFFGKTSNHPGDSALLQPRFGTLRLLAFPKIKITFEREELSGGQWDSGKYDGAADSNSNKGFCWVFWTVEEIWEDSVRSQGAYFEGDWGVIVLCTVFLASCIFFSKCLYLSFFLMPQTLTVLTQSSAVFHS